MGRERLPCAREGSGGRDWLPCVRGAGAGRRLRGCGLTVAAREREIRQALQPLRRCAAPPLTQGRLAGGRDRLPCVRGAGAGRRLRGCKPTAVAREREIRQALQPHRRCAAPPLTQGRLSGGRDRLPCVRGAGAGRRLRGCGLTVAAREREIRQALQPHRRCAAPPLTQGRL